MLKKIILYLSRNNNIRNLYKKNSLSGGGERVDINLNEELISDNLDMYQKSHLERYIFADRIIKENTRCGDFACGTGYGSVLLSKNRNVLGIDLEKQVIKSVSLRYKELSNVKFECKNLLKIDFENEFDTIVSFETIEHFDESDLVKLLKIFHKSLKLGGYVLFSTPYMQHDCENARKLGFHRTFLIDEKKILDWSNNSGFAIEKIWYQNYKTHIILDNLDHKDFILCKLTKF
jgi:2-polyprenyl-3-methyl-5-hydroxy-6-metoxy-1,4-benzoquinol methylase